MKVREGFVSNSSSSSFLVAYHTKEDFDRFSKFRGYDGLVSRLSDKRNTCLTRAVEHVDMVIRNYLHGYASSMLDRVRGTEMYGSEIGMEEYQNLIWLNDELDQEEFMEPIDKYRIDVQEMIDRKCEAGAFDGGNDKFIYDTYMDAMDEALKMIPDTRAIAEAICQWIIMKRGMLISTVEYSDDENYGSYMEHEFMPFVANCPEAEFFIHRHSMH